MANILECCKKFETYLKNTKDEPTKWHEDFTQIFQEFLKSKLHPRESKVLQEMQKDLTRLSKKGQNWAKEQEYKKVFTNFKRKTPSEAEIDTQQAAEYFSKTIPNAIAEAFKKHTEEIANAGLDAAAISIITKYMGSAQDVKNLVKTNSMNTDLFEKYKYNPIPITSKKIRALFPNIETQYIYGDGDIVFTDGKIKEPHVVCLDKNNAGKFKNVKGLKNITISTDLTEIPNGAFFGCKSLESVTIPKGVTKIGDNAFGDCTKLTSVTIPKGVKTIDDGAFASCTNLKSVTIPKSVTKIGIIAFSDCSEDLELIFDEGINDNIELQASGRPKSIKHKGDLSDDLKQKLTYGFWGNLTTPHATFFKKI